MSPEDHAQKLAEAAENAQYLSPKTLAVLMNVAPSTLYRWTSIGKLPQPYRFGLRCSRWKRTEVVAALEKWGREGTQKSEKELAEQRKKEIRAQEAARIRAGG